MEELETIAKKLNWTWDDNGDYYCHCGERLKISTGVFVLPRVKKEIVYCDKCRDSGISRNLAQLTYDKWSIQDRISSIIEDFQQNNK